jgi:hypothetical protein
VSIVDFVIQRKDLSEQNERLKGLTGKGVADLMQLLDDIGRSIIDLDEALTSDSKAKCQRLLDDGQKLCEVIEKQV